MRTRHSSKLSPAKLTSRIVIYELRFVCFAEQSRQVFQVEQSDGALRGQLRCPELRHYVGGCFELWQHFIQHVGQ